MSLEVSIQKLRQRSLFIATPMFDGLCHHTYAQSLAGLVHALTRMGVDHYLHIIANESLVQRARNYCAQEFMSSGMTHMMFIDADIGFRPEAVIDMLAWADPQGEHQIMAAPYPKKTITFEKVFSAYNKGLIPLDKPQMAEKYVGDFVFNVSGQVTFQIDTPFRVEEAGTGFLLIQRRAFELIADRNPAMYYLPDHARTPGFDGSREICAYFHCDIDRGSPSQEWYDVITACAEGHQSARKRARSLLSNEKKATRRMLSEDYWFCHRAREAGLGIWMCPWIELSHSGRYVWDAKLIDILQAGLSATFDKEEQKA